MADEVKDCPGYLPALVRLMSVSRRFPGRATGPARSTTSNSRGASTVAAYSVRACEGLLRRYRCSARNSTRCRAPTTEPAYAAPRRTRRRSPLGRLTLASASAFQKLRGVGSGAADRPRSGIGLHRGDAEEALMDTAHLTRAVVLLLLADAWAINSVLPGDSSASRKLGWSLILLLPVLGPGPLGPAPWLAPGDLTPTQQVNLTGDCPRTAKPVPVPNASSPAPMVERDGSALCGCMRQRLPQGEPCGDADCSCGGTTRPLPRWRRTSAGRRREGPFPPATRSP